MYVCTFDRSCRNSGRDASAPARRVCMPGVNVRHMLPSVGQFKFQIDAKKRSESVDANRYASISHRTRGKPPGCQYREQYAITCTMKLEFLRELLDHTLFCVYIVQYIFNRYVFPSKGKKRRKKYVENSNLLNGTWNFLSSTNTSFNIYLT